MKKIFILFLALIGIGCGADGTNINELYSEQEHRITPIAQGDIRNESAQQITNTFVLNDKASWDTLKEKLKQFELQNTNIPKSEFNFQKYSYIAVFANNKDLNIDEISVTKAYTINGTTHIETKAVYASRIRNNRVYQIIKTDKLVRPINFISR